MDNNNIENVNNENINNTNMNNKNMDDTNSVSKKKLYGMILGVIAFIALVAGLTYAWFVWISNNTIIEGDSGCFTIVYQNGSAISGNLLPSADYTGGKTTTVTLNINPSCTTQGNATINLTTNPASTIDLTEHAVKYAVYQGENSVSAGYVSGGTEALATFPLTTVATTYTVYIWVDGAIATSEYIGTSYAGNIVVTAIQTENTSS